MNLYTAVWRPGSGAQWAHPGLSWADFKTQDTTYFNQGLRIVDFEIEAGKYTGVWRPGSGAQWIHPSLTWAEFKAQDTAYFNQGLRIVDIEIDGGKYGAAWRPGSGAQWVHPGLTWAQFKAQDTTYFNQGLRLVDIEVEGSAFTGVWRPGSGAQWVHPGLTPTELVAQDKVYAAKGLRIHVLKVADGRLTAVWRPGSGAQVIQMGLSWDLFKEEDKKNFDKGLRLQALEVHEKPLVIYRLPWALDAGWSLVNGNWDDPISGHGGGSPSAKQAYAYDFAHAEGGNISAARGGTVYDFDESSSTNGFNSATPCNPGVGNYLVIDHHDGTYGVYWHMKKDGVKVGLGETISRGDLIAVSGNTGNSGGPHLHFEVRIGWDLSYSCSNLSESRSLPAFLEDKNHTWWRPKVGDSFATNNT